MASKYLATARSISITAIMVVTIVAIIIIKLAIMIGLIIAFAEMKDMFRSWMLLVIMKQFQSVIYCSYRYFRFRFSFRYLPLIRYHCLKYLYCSLECCQ